MLAVARWKGFPDGRSCMTSCWSKIEAAVPTFRWVSVRAALLLVVVILVPLQVQAEPWRLTSQKEGIKVEARTLSGERFDELRVSTVVPVAPHTVADFLVGAYLDQANKNIRRTFVKRSRELTIWSDVLTAPAISARCYSMRFERSSLQANGEVKVRFSSTDYIGPKPSVDCILLKTRGEWNMAPVAEGTRLTYVSLTDVGGGTPAVLVRRSLTNAAVQSVEKVTAGALGLQQPRD